MAPFSSAGWPLAPFLWLLDDQEIWVPLISQIPSTGFLSIFLREQPWDLSTLSCINPWGRPCCWRSFYQNFLYRVSWLIVLTCVFFSVKILLAITGNWQVRMMKVKFPKFMFTLLIWFNLNNNCFVDSLPLQCHLLYVRHLSVWDLERCSF